MAVYTHLGAGELAELIAQYDVGTVRSAKGIAEGVSNSNWLIETTKGHYILTMYERRIETSDLPFFLGLLDHLAAANCPVPRTIHDREGAAYRMIGDKAVALIEFLPGVSPDQPNAQQAHSVGKALAEMHLAAADYPLQRVNTLGPDAWLEMLESCGHVALAGIDPALPSITDTARRVREKWPKDLPETIIHSDLFPDNVLQLDGRISGMIDFYFACTGAAAYDLAVTHAAWCFTPDGSSMRDEISAALFKGYESIRALSDKEKAAFPLFCQGACLRFIASRAVDWIDTPEDALVSRKNPMEFVNRLSLYLEKADKGLSLL